jgi:hypothetical protein
MKFKLSHQALLFSCVAQSLRDLLFMGTNMSAGGGMSNSLIVLGTHFVESFILLILTASL